MFKVVEKLTAILTNEEIKLHLDQKMKELLGLVTSDVKEIIEGKCYFAGGCIRSLLEGNKPKDYDLFFVDQETVDKLEPHKYTLGLDYVNSYTIKTLNTTFQLIKIEAGSPLSTVKAFDFTFNQNYYFNGTLVIMSPTHIRNRTIVVNYKCRNPFDTFFRIIKFIDRGYKIESNVELTKMAMRLSQLTPLTTHNDVKNITKQCASDICDTGLLL